MRNMMITNIKRLYLVLTLALVQLSCSSGTIGDDIPTPTPETLIVEKTELFTEGNESQITINITASASYTVASSVKWIMANSSSGTGNLEVQLAANNSFMPRSGQITVKLGKLSKSININQKGKYVFVAADKTGMESDAKTLAAKMNVGWNLGNSLDAYNIGDKETEISWGNPKVTEAMIKEVKAAGFNTIRIPIRWYPHIQSETDFKVDDTWMSRVKEIVDYCIKNDLYTIINTHHELWLEGNALYADSALIHKKENALWKQIALTFRDYDEKLIFAGTNEVHINNYWGIPSNENTTVQNLFNQWFVDAVRETGGHNSYRNLIIQTYAANPNYGISSLKMPSDHASNRLMIEFHDYEPTDYCLNDDIKFWGNDYKTYGISSWGQEAYLDDLFSKLKAKFVDKGYPLLLGEFGVVNHSYPTEELAQKGAECRAAYLKRMVSLAHRSGAVPVLWDNGNTNKGTECFGYFDRKNNMQITDKLAIDAIMEGTKTAYPF